MVWRESPEQFLKQGVRDLEDRVPALNEALAMLKAQVTLAQKNVAKLEAKEVALLEKIEGAERHDIALNYAVTLSEVRRETEHEERELRVAQAAFAKAQGIKQEFMETKERRALAVREALAAKRRSEWNQRVAEIMGVFDPERSDPVHDTIVQQLNDDAAESGAYLGRVLDEASAVDAQGMRALLGTLRTQVEALERQLRWTREQVNAFEVRLAGFPKE